MALFWAKEEREEAVEGRREWEERKREGERMGGR